MIAILVVVLATGADIFSRRQDQAFPLGRAGWIRAVAYSFSTVLVAFEMAAGGWWDLLHIEYVRVVLAHLGYPMYLLYILGVLKIPCAIVLLVPGFPRLKEWAYAGAIFDYAGAAASHLFAGDGVGMWAAPLILVGITMASWALGSPYRKLLAPGYETRLRPARFAVPIAIVAGMSVVALLTLPKDAPKF